VTREAYLEEYASVLEGDDTWRALSTPTGNRCVWAEESTYVRKPPFFDGISMQPPALTDIEGARALLVLGDTVTTDHISPAGSIPASSPAGRYLQEKGISPREFNSYGSRRGNHEVMMRGTFANVRIRNELAQGKEGGYSCHLPSGEVGAVYDVAMRYRDEGTPLIVIGGKDYGSGSSRDWAAKGTLLLGVRAVLAESFERIHRSNLVGMGVLPLQFLPGQTRTSLGLTGEETFSIANIRVGLKPGATVRVKTVSPGGASLEFGARVRIDTQVELAYYEHGGILHYVLRQLAGSN
jgi:aconitate hydratase